MMHVIRRSQLIGLMTMDGSTATEYDRHTLNEATEFLQEKWQDLQQSISRTSRWTKSALDSAWKKLIHQ